MSDLSNYRAMGRAQARWDAMEPDYDDPPWMTNLLELQAENSDLRDKLAQLLEEARDLAETANRMSPCAGDRLLRRCNEIEGIPPSQDEDEDESQPQEEYET